MLHAGSWHLRTAEQVASSTRARLAFNRTAHHHLRSIETKPNHVHLRCYHCEKYRHTDYLYTNTTRYPGPLYPRWPLPLVFIIHNTFVLIFWKSAQPDTTVARVISAKFYQQLSHLLVLTVPYNPITTSRCTERDLLPLQHLPRLRRYINNHRNGSWSSSHTIPLTSATVKLLLSLALQCCINNHLIASFSSSYTFVPTLLFYTIEFHYHWTNYYHCDVVLMITLPARSHRLILFYWYFAMTNSPFHLYYSSGTHSDFLNQGFGPNRFDRRSNVHTPGPLRSYPAQ